MNDLKLTIPKIDVLKIIDVLDDFAGLCKTKGVRFSKYTDEQLLEILHLYRNYRGSGKAPF